MLEWVSVIYTITTPQPEGAWGVLFR